MPTIIGILFAALYLVLPGSGASAQDLGPFFKTIKPGIYVYASRPGQANSTIILTQDGVVLIDTGTRPTDSVAVMKAIKQLTPLPVRVLIDTEPHPDHSAGNFVFSPPAVIVGAAGVGESMRRAPDRIESQRAESPEMRAALEGYRLVTPHIEYQNKMTLDMGERSFELTYIKNVHSEADTAIWMPKEKILFAAAAITDKRFGNLRPFVSIPDTLAAIKMMKAYPAEVVIPNHGNPGTKAMLDDLETYYNLLLERVGALVKQGKTLDQIKSELKMPEYDGWGDKNNFDNNIAAAYRAVAG